MRITNKIMQNNNLTNINMNKVLQDKLSTQMSTEKKISKPSDDPVIAIRALRLRGNVTEVTQYYSKNIPDAESWLNVTEGALKNTSEVLKSMIGQCTKGANGDLTSKEREIILEQLKALRDEVYSTADVDYAGRYVFAGYRTDTSISFPMAEEIDYTITQQLDNTAIDEVTFVKTTKQSGGGYVDINNLNSTNYQSIDVQEAEVDEVKVHRIRLNYKDLAYDDANHIIPTIERVGKDANGNITTEDLSATGVIGNIEVVHSYDVPTAYELAAEAANSDKVYLIPETGELILGDNVYREMMSYQDDVSTSTINEAEIRVTYQKSNWLKGDLRPEHYYACSSIDPATGEETVYNPTYLNGTDVAKQVIEYDVGFNQTVRVNTRVDECFDPGIGREADDLINVLEDVQSLEDVVSKIDEMLAKETDETERATLTSRRKAANKALTLAKNKKQRMFEGGITAFQKYLDDNNLAITNCGTRSSKLELVENRMKEQKTTFETLKSENEDVDITEVIINLTSAELTYQAALMATGKIAQTTLLNFI